MKLAAIAVISLASVVPAAAGGASFVDGVWTGKGTFQIGDKVVSCPAIKMKFVGSETTYEVREASMTCDDLGTQNFSEIDKFTVGPDGVVTFVMEGPSGTHSILDTDHTRVSAHWAQFAAVNQYAR